jgi:uncharacterized protein
MTRLPSDQKPPVQRVGAAVSRPIFFVLGVVFLVVGVTGIVLPLVPGTVFLILAAACFTRSSPRIEKWLVSHPVLGPPVVKWRETGAIPRWVKWIACLSLAISWLVVLASDAPGIGRAASFVIFLGVAVYIVSRPEA